MQNKILTNFYLHLQFLAVFSQIRIFWIGTGFFLADSDPDSGKKKVQSVSGYGQKGPDPKHTVIPAMSHWPPLLYTSSYIRPPTIDWLGSSLLLSWGFFLSLNVWPVQNGNTSRIDSKKNKLTLFNLFNLLYSIKIHLWVP